MVQELLNEFARSESMCICERSGDWDADFAKLRVKLAGYADVLGLVAPKVGDER